MSNLLAVDLGLHVGLALYGEDGRLRWYRSQNYGAPQRLRRAIPALLDGISHLVIEGGGELAVPWSDAAFDAGVDLRWVSAETWRRAFLYPREQRSGLVAKRTADDLARRVIAWSGAKRPTSLRHDAAEAVLIGLWGVLELGWLPALPPAWSTWRIKPAPDSRHRHVAVRLSARCDACDRDVILTRRTRRAASSAVIGASCETPPAPVAQ